MMKMEMEGMGSLRRKVMNASDKLDRGKRQFLHTHLQRDVKIQGTVIRHIHREVYQAHDPTAYERTHALLESVNMSVGDDEITIYLDGDYLRRASDTEFSWKTGFAPEAKSVNYSWLVHEGHTYRNTQGAPYDALEDYQMPPRRFMDKAWRELLSQMDVGVILRPLIRLWRL